VNTTTYRLQLALDNTFATLVVDTVVVDTSATLSTALEYSTSYFWRVSGGNVGGFGTPSSPQLFTTMINPGGGVADLPGVPKVYALMQNYPNPFNPSTRITYDVPKSAHVKLVIYDVLGRVVTRLVDGVQTANRYSVEWNASRVSTGVYFLRMEADNADGSGNFTSVKKMILMK
jgi:hypothetical protein